MLVALIGVIGILIGGMLQAFASYLLARRTERREAATAARLVLPELLENRHRLRTALELRRWSHIDFQTTRWRQHEITIAGGLGKEWRQLTSVYTALVLFNVDRQFEEEGAPIDSADDLEHLQLASDNLDEAIVDLCRWAGIPSVEVIAAPEVADAREL